MLKNDLIRLKHISESAQSAQEFATGLTRADLETDRRTVFALIRCIEIIGEAANALSDEFKSAHPEIPWRDIVSMRNRLIHAYFDVDLDIVWSAVTMEVPSLAGVVDAVIASEDDAT